MSVPLLRDIAMLGFIACLSGCGPKPAEPKPAEPDAIEPSAFAGWPSVHEKPIRVPPDNAVFCRSASGPHADHHIVVRISPEAMGAFREGKPLPTGAVVVKEKYTDAAATGPLKEYALMIKREAGYDPANGNWEYAYVEQLPERKVTRGKLTECAGCHAGVKNHDYLFSSYGR